MVLHFAKSGAGWYTRGYKIIDWSSMDNQVLSVAFIVLSIRIFLGEEIIAFGNLKAKKWVQKIDIGLLLC